MRGGKISLHGYKTCLQFSEIGKAEGHVDWRQNRFSVVAPHTTRYHLRFTVYREHISRKHITNAAKLRITNSMAKKCINDSQRGMLLYTKNTKTEEIL
jgi:hypothetical protein